MSTEQCARCGKPHSGTICRVCSVIVWRQRRKLKAVRFLGGKCVLCGFDKYITALHFHHVDPTQKDHNLVNKTISWVRLEQELRKCVLLCSNCHTALHGGEIQASFEVPKDVTLEIPYVRNPLGKESKRTCLKCGKRSVNEVCKKCLSEKIQTKVLALKEEGLTPTEIADQMNMSVASICFRLNPGVHNRGRKK